MNIEEPNWMQEIDLMVRDFCAVGMNSKSRVRSRINTFYNSLLAHKSKQIEEAFEKGFMEAEGLESPYATIQKEANIRYLKMCRKFLSQDKNITNKEDIERMQKEITSIIRELK